MRSSTVAAFVPFIAGILAAPAPVPQSSEPVCEPWGCENITISGLSLLRKEAATSVSQLVFTLVGSLNPDREFQCSATNPSVGEDIYRCRDSSYSFRLSEGSSQQYALLVQHQLSVGRGLTGTSDLELNCSAAGESGNPATTDYNCTQNGPSQEFVIDSAPE